MRDAQQTGRRPRRWKRVLGLLAAVAAAAVLTVVFLPRLLPEAALAREVARVLGERLGRPVTVESARYSWGGGLEISGLRVGQGGEAGETPLATARLVTVKFSPAEATQVFTEGDLPVDSMRVEGLEFRLVLQRDGRTNIDDLLSRPAGKIRTVQVTDAVVHVESRGAGRSIRLENVDASAGELESTGNGYLSLSADLAGTRPGHLVVTANLDRRPDRRDADPAAGSLKAEWSDLAWPEVWAVLGADPRLPALLSRVSGRMSATFGRHGWTAEGAVEAADLVLAGAATPQEWKVPQVILGFQVRQAAADKPFEIALVKCSAPGVDLKITGRGRLERAPRPEGASPDAEAAEPPPWTLKDVDLRAVGAITWAPLCQNVAPLGREATKFERLGGRAALDLHLVAAPGGPRLTGWADLTDTLAVWHRLVRKQERQVLRLTVAASCPEDLSAADLKALELVTDAGRTHVSGRVPLAPLLGRTGARGAGGASPDSLARRLAGASLNVHADIREFETLVEMIPALAAPLGPLEAAGPLDLTVALAPEESPDAPAGAPPSWTAKVVGNLTGMTVGRPDGSHKPAARPATFEAVATVTPDARRADVRHLTVNLDKTALAWDGSARIEWPPDGEAPAGQFQGSLEVSQVESAGAILLPHRFAAQPPVSGGAVFDVQAVLSGGRLQSRMKAGLERMEVRAGDYFAKPAGQAASLALTSLWESGTPNHVEAMAEVDLPSVHLTALGRSEVVVRWLDLSSAPPEAAEAPAPGAADDAAVPPPQSALHVTFAPTSTLEVRARVSDLSRAAEYSTLLKAGLKGFKVEGGAEGHAVLSMRPQVIKVDGGVDLTDALLDVGPYLQKPVGRTLTVDLVADVAPPSPESIEVRLTSVEARLGDSAARAGGRVRLDRQAVRATAGGAAGIAALLEEADLKVQADWNHNADLRRALPWLEPLYARCDLEGPTTWTLAVSGTPLRGEVRLEADATRCRIAPGHPASPAAAATPPAGSAGPAGAIDPVPVLKPAETPAAVRLDLRYGEVPGEMILDRFELKLANATASATGRLLFDDPRFVLLQLPTAWAFHVAGEVPDAAILGSMLPSRLADLKPQGAVSVDLRAASDAQGAEVESCDLVFRQARVEWLGKPILLDGPIAYNYQRLATEGLNLGLGGSDLTVVAYIARPHHDPTGSVFLRGKRLDVQEVQDMLRETTEYLAAGPAAAGSPASPRPSGPVPGRPAEAISDRLAREGQRLLAGAQLAFEVSLDRVTLAMPQWGTTFDLAGLSAEGRLAERRFVLPQFACTLNQGAVSGEMVLDFREKVPVISVAYEARNLQMGANLKPFIDTTFPGMQVFGTLSLRESFTQALAQKAYRVGRGETVLVDGLLEGPGAPDYIANLLPGLKLTQYPFNRMSNLYENKANGDVDNRMIFDGKAYDVYIFGVTHADGRTDYELGVDLSVSVGSKVISRTLDQGKLPMMYYTGRIVGTQFAEIDIRYVLPHEFAYNVFVRRNLLLQLIRSIGEKEPEIKRPLVAPSEKDRAGGEG